MASTCLDIVTQAMREIGALNIGKEPKAAESEAGLFRLQSIVDGLFGNGVGAILQDQEVNATGDLVADTRVLVLATSSITLTMPESPFNGARIQLKDMAGNLATYPLTIDGNNRNIEGAPTLTASTNNYDRTWMYVAETANWAQITTLALTDQLALNDDEFFSLALAKRMAPLFGLPFPQTSETALLRAANRIRAKYASKVVTPCDDAVRFLSDQSYNTGFIR